jgi:hypothetical protein
MDEQLKAKLEKAGYTVSNTQEFLGLSDDEIKIIDLELELEEIKTVLKSVGPFGLVTGDSIQRTSPNNHLRLNSQESWLVSSGKRSFMSLIEDVKLINKYC